jgi:hypothetical protein
MSGISKLTHCQILPRGSHDLGAGMIRLEKIDFLLEGWICGEVRGVDF